MYFEKPRFLWGEPFFGLKVIINFKEKRYSLGLIVAHFEIFGLYTLGDFWKGITILGFGIHSY